MKMCGIVPNMAHKSDLGANSTLSFLSLFLISSFIGTTLDDFTSKPLGIRTWSFNRNCRWYIGLQLLFRLFSLMINGLGVLSSPKLVVSRP